MVGASFTLLIDPGLPEVWASWMNLFWPGVGSGTLAWKLALV
jgi:hypothetical protein